MCAEQSSVVSICKISMQTGTLVRYGSEFVTTLFERSHRGLIVRKTEKCLEEECVCFGKCR